ncbi:hypothetical protein EBMC1_13603, partial [Sphingopyxis sp. MC1]
HFRGARQRLFMFHPSDERAVRVFAGLNPRKSSPCKLGEFSGAGESAAEFIDQAAERIGLGFLRLDPEFLQYVACSEVEITTLLSPEITLAKFKIIGQL